MVRNADATGQAAIVQGPAQITQKTIPALENQIDNAISEKPEGIDLHMGAVEIVDSFGLNWLIELHARLTSCGIKLQLIEVSRLVMDIFAVTRLESRFVMIAKEEKPEGERNA